MDDQSSNENTSELTELSLKEKELALKEREIAFKEREAEQKLQLEKRNVWLNSTLLIAIVSTIFGGALVASLQGYWNFRLEKQKSEFFFQLERQQFEFSLIQKSLEIEDKLIEDQNEIKESAKKLLFLVESGIIQSLNSESIEKLANNPNKIPAFSKSFS